MIKKKNIFYKIKNNNITAKRIVLISVFLSILVISKYIFGFVPGIETTTFLFVIFGIFLPLMDLSLLIIAFNLTVLIIYGFTNSWLMYWVIWTIIPLGSKILSIKIKNCYIFALWGFVAGFSMIFWFYLLDSILWGFAKANSSAITALPINLIEGFGTMFLIATLSRPIQKVFNHFSPIFFIKKPFKFTFPKKYALNLFTLFSLTSISFASIVTIFIVDKKIVTWENNSLRKGIDQRENTYFTDKIYQDIKNLPLSNSDQNDQYLNNQSYTTVKRTLQKIPGKQISLVIIAEDRAYVDIINVPSINDSTHISDIMRMSNRFNFVTNPGGSVVYEFGFKKFKDQTASATDKWGKSNKKWHEHYYPGIYLNRSYINLYIQKQLVKENDIIEFTYDHS